MDSSSPEYDFLDDAMDDGFDPLQDDQPDEDDETELPVVLIGATAAIDRSDGTAVAEADTRTSEERIADLFSAMAQRRTILLGILTFVQEARRAEDLDAEVEQLQRNNRSVYSAANYSDLLEKAGAIRLVTADGADFADSRVDPQIVEVDGVEYYEPGAPPQPYWIITAAGAAYLKSDKPLDRLRELLEREAAYLPIYQRVLTMCATAQGATIKELSDAVDADELVQRPRRYASFFTDRLEKCDALEWADHWMITSTGRKGLELLDSLMDPESAALTDGEVRP